MKRRTSITLTTVAIIVVIAIAVPLTVLNSQTRWRAEWEHGIALPASATSFQCRGDANRLLLDRGASTVFVMAAADVPLLNSKLTVNQSLQTFVPENPQYHGFAFPWGATTPIETLSRASPMGDWLHVEFYPVDDGRVGVWMYTDWN